MTRISEIQNPKKQNEKKMILATKVVLVGAAMIFGLATGTVGLLSQEAQAARCVWIATTTSQMKQVGVNQRVSMGSLVVLLGLGVMENIHVMDALQRQGKLRYPNQAPTLTKE